MTTKEMIEVLRYKANNIKAKIEPEFFNEVADKLEMQVEKKVIVSPYNGMKYCPICEVSVTGMHFDYCVECGQKLDWSEVD